MRRVLRRTNHHGGGGAPRQIHAEKTARSDYRPAAPEDIEVKHHGTITVCMGFITPGATAKPSSSLIPIKKPHFPFLVQQRYYDMYKDRVSAPKVTDKMIAKLPLMSQKERETYGFGLWLQELVLRRRGAHSARVVFPERDPPGREHTCPDNEYGHLPDPLRPLRPGKTSRAGRADPLCR
jgi:hypothetical protein